MVGMSRLERPMPHAMTEKPTVLMVADLGSSASKVFYRVGGGATLALWMGAEVAPNLSQAVLTQFRGSTRPQDSAWLELGEQVVLVGESAKACLESNSIRANKSELAAYKIAAALGVVAELESLPPSFEAVLWLALPLTELGTRDAIRKQAEAICQGGFRFRGEPRRVGLRMQAFPEGFGLYLNRKGELEAVGQEINQRRTLIVMMGHRNLSVLCFDGGSLRAAGSNSNGPGFWPIFEKAARSAGVTQPDYGFLMAAIASNQSQQLSVAHGRLFDFSEPMTACLDTYWQAVLTYWQDQVMPQLEVMNTEVIISGGASSILRSRLSAYFTELGLSQQVLFTEGGPRRLEALVRGVPESAQIPSMTLRMADSYGLFRGLIGTLDSVAV